VQQQTMSAPVTAASKVSVTLARGSRAATALASAGLREAIRMSVQGRRLAKAARCSLPCAPAPRMARTRESARDSTSAASAAVCSANRRDGRCIHDGGELACGRIECGDDALMRMVAERPVARKHRDEFGGHAKARDVTRHCTDDSIGGRNADTWRNVSTLHRDGFESYRQSSTQGRLGQELTDLVCRKEDRLGHPLLRSVPDFTSSCTQCNCHCGLSDVTLL